MKHTLNNLIDYLQTFAVSHKQINSFEFGEEFDLEADSAKNAPLMWANVVDTTIDNSLVNTKFTLMFIDLVHADKSNENEVLSDQLLIAQDCIAYFSNISWANLNLFIDKNITLSVVKDENVNSWTGWTFELNFKQEFYSDYCQIPLIS